MDSPGTAPPVAGATALTRALCLFMLALMTAAAVYGGIMALRYYSQIGV